MIGKYILKKDTNVSMNRLAFTASKGAIVEVLQYDKNNRNVLIKFGKFIDWFYQGWIDRNAVKVGDIDNDELAQNAESGVNDE